MKLIFTIPLAAITALATAQDKHLVPKEKWTKDLYLSDEFCAGKGLKPGETNDLLRAWNNLDEHAQYSRVVDIRWYFSSPAAASAYLSSNIQELSESGDEVKTKVSIPMVNDLRVFREGAGTRDMNKALGIKINMYFFLFTVKNYVAKVFISSEKDLAIDEVAVFAKEAARRLNAAVK